MIPDMARPPEAPGALEEREKLMKATEDKIAGKMKAFFEKRMSATDPRKKAAELPQPTETPEAYTG